MLRLFSTYFKYVILRFIFIFILLIYFIVYKQFLYIYVTTYKGFAWNVWVTYITIMLLYIKLDIMTNQNC